MRPKTTLHPTLQNIAVIGTLSKVFVVPVSVGSLLCSIHGFHAVIVQLSSHHKTIYQIIFFVSMQEVAGFYAANDQHIGPSIVDIVISGPK